MSVRWRGRDLMSELTKYFSNVTIVESKKGVKVMKRTADILDKHLLEDTEPLTLRCGYVNKCNERINGFCAFKGKWCSQQIKENIGELKL